MRAHIPCPCGKSSDAYTQYDDHGHCYSCNKQFWPERERMEEAKPVNSFTYQQVPYRGHSVNTLQKYNVRLKVADDSGQPFEVDYPWDNNGTMVRILADKKFRWIPYSGPGLFGADVFPAGSARYITVTEGAEDAMAAFEMLGSKYPVVSVQNAQSAARDCAARKEYLDSFERIYLCFDNDDPGRQAEAAVSQLFPYNKVYIVRKTTRKDANDYLLNGEGNVYTKLWYNAKLHNPESIVSSFDELADIFKIPKKKAICSFPFKELQDTTHGIRTGETYLFKALEGIGKTEVLGAIEYHAVKTCDFPIGVIHLEEDIQRTALRLVGYEVGSPVHLEGQADISPEQLLKIYKDLTRYDNRVNYYVQGKNDENVDLFLSSIRFMVAQAQCKIVFFDHISRVATNFNLDTAGLDNFATRLSKLALELDFALLMISHVNDDGLTRGSRNISKEAWTVISLQRDKLSHDAMERNTTRFIVEKNRHASVTGPAGEVYFDMNTFKLTDNKPLVLPPVAEKDAA